MGAWITGIAGLGNVLTANLAPQLGTASTWQWKRNGTNIAGATSSTYTQVSADLGTTVSVLVNGTYTGSLAVPPAALQLAATPITTGVTGSAYTGFTAAASGGVAPYAYGLNAAALSAGLAINSSTGVVSGATLAAANTFACSVIVTDAASSTAHVDWNLVVSAQPAFPAADQFSFSDAFNAGNTVLRDRTGWAVQTADTRVQGTQTVNTGTPSLTLLDGFGTNGFAYQDTGRLDGGTVGGVLATSASDWFLNANVVDEQNQIRVDFASTLNRVRIFKRLAGADTSLFDSGVVASLFAVGQAVSINYSWSGTTCTVTLTINGARYPNSSTSWTFSASGSLQPCGRVGVATTGVWTSYTSGMLSSAPHASLNKVHRLYQRNKADSTGAVPIGGVAKGCTTLQFRLLQSGSVVSGWDWGQHSISNFTVDGTTGVWSGKVTGIPQGNGYQIAVRDSVDNNAGSQSRPFDIGSIWILWGQSLATQAFDGTGRTIASVANAWYPRSKAPVTDQRFNPINFESEMDWDGTVAGSDTGQSANLSQAVAAAAFRAAAGTLSLGFINGGYGSHAMASFLSSDVTVPYTAGPSRTLWQNLSALIDFFGGDIEGIVWDQGQEDAGRTYNAVTMTTTTRDTYAANFASYIAAIRSYVGRTATQLPVLIMGLGRLYPAGGTLGNYACDPCYDLFRQMQYNLSTASGSGIAIANCSLVSTQMDLTLTSTTTNEVHLTGTADFGYPEDLCRVGYGIAKAMGFATTDRRGALPLSIARTSTTLAITYDANSASALTCAASIATNVVFWTDNTYATQLTPTAMNIAALGGGQIVVTWTFAATAAGNVATSGKGGANSTGGIYPDMVNALKATQPDGKSVVTWPIFAPLVAA